MSHPGSTTWGCDIKGMPCVLQMLRRVTTTCLHFALLVIIPVPTTESNRYHRYTTWYCGLYEKLATLYCTAASLPRKTRNQAHCPAPNSHLRRCARRRVASDNGVRGFGCCQCVGIAAFGVAGLTMTCVSGWDDDGHRRDKGLSTAVIGSPRIRSKYTARSPYAARDANARDEDAAWER
eukprot:3703795-Pyramimonas_sp.AAC.1